VNCHELSLDDLQETARSAVRDGIISATDLQGARATVARLRADEMLPPCPAPSPRCRTRRPAPAPPVGNTPARPGAPADEHGATPTPGNTPATGQGAAAGGSPQAPETTTLPSVPPEPGKTCRPVS